MENVEAISSSGLSSSVVILGAFGKAKSRPRADVKRSKTGFARCRRHPKMAEVEENDETQIQKTRPTENPGRCASSKPRVRKGSGAKET